MNPVTTLRLLYYYLAAISTLAALGIIDIILIKKNNGGYKEIYKEINNYLE